MMKRLKQLRPSTARLLCAALILCMTGLQWLQLDLSCGVRVVHILSRRLVYHFVDLGFVFIIDLLFLLFTRRWHLAYLFSSVFFCVWGIADHYVWLFTGDALTITVLRSAGTALDVLHGYRLTLSVPILCILVGTAFNICLSLLLKKLCPDPIPWRRIWAPAAGLAVLCGAFALSSNALEKLDPAEQWTTRLDLENYGYPLYFYRQAVRTFHQIQRPAGYDEGLLATLSSQSEPDASVPDGALPDIVLILNESYYFLDDYADIDADVSYNENWSSLPNAILGRAVVPLISSGTNRTEYEYLTSNSMFLVSAHAPFNTLDLTEANSVVRYLERFGYSSCAMHDASQSNYSRGRAYPAMGFDRALFNHYFKESSYGERIGTDSSNYQDMFTAYLDGGDGPRFMYLLSYQNHGGYEQNDESLDTVHTGQDFGEYTDDVNEYLTSVKMSDDALRDLTDFFNGVDRPVIVCMVGDHCPNIVPKLPARSDLTEKDREIVARSTPFFIWANDAFGPIEEKRDLLVTVSDLVPMVLETAGIPLSPYYRTILDLSEQFPARLSTGVYRDADGEYGAFARDDPNYDLLAPYYFMEYNNLQKPADRYQVLFDPPVGTE